MKEKPKTQEAEVAVADFEKEDEEELIERPVPEEIATVTGPHIEERNGKEWIVKVDTKRLPCKDCTNQKDCQAELRAKAKIEFYRPNATCVTYEKGSEQNP